MEEKTNKIIGRNQSLKETKKKKIKQVKQRVQIDQVLNTEIEAIRKTQTEGILEMENLSK